MWRREDGMQVDGPILAHGPAEAYCGQLTFELYASNATMVISEAVSLDSSAKYGKTLPDWRRPKHGDYSEEL